MRALLGTQEIRIAPATVAIDDDRLAAVLAAHSRAVRLFSYMDAQCWALLAGIALAQGRGDVAAERLREAVALGIDAYGLRMLADWAPWAELLRSQALRETLGLNGAAVDEHLRVFRARAAAAPRAASTALDWKAAIRAHDRRCAGTIQGGWVDAHDPPSPALRERERAGKSSGRGASAAALAALQRRLDLALPPSYLAFLSASDGLLVPDGVVNLLPAAEVDRFIARNAEWAETWIETEGGHEVDDDRYHTYGADQDCVWMRARYLRTALQVSDVMESEVILLNPQVRFGDEWEAWYFGAKLPGAYRYRSFAELMRTQVFERERG